MSETAVRVALHRGLTAIARRFGRPLRWTRTSSLGRSRRTRDSRPHRFHLPGRLAAVRSPSLWPQSSSLRARSTTRHCGARPRRRASSLSSVVTVTLAASAFGAGRALSRPGEAWRRRRSLSRGRARARFCMAVVVELFVCRRSVVSATGSATNIVACLTLIPLIGIGPLVIFLLALRHGAPTRPSLAGAVAGLLAGGIAATFYAAKCTDDSPLFVATWYTIAIAVLVLIGAIAGDRFARW